MNRRSRLTERDGWGRGAGGGTAAGGSGRGTSHSPAHVYRREVRLGSLPRDRAGQASSCARRKLRRLALPLSLSCFFFFGTKFSVFRRKKRRPFTAISGGYLSRNLGKVPMKVSFLNRFVSSFPFFSPVRDNSDLISDGMLPR